MIEVQSKFDQNITTPVLRLQVRRLWWLFVVLSVFFIFGGVMFVIAPEPDMFIGIFLIVVGILFVPLVFLLSIALQKTMNKTMKLMSQETSNYFKFDENKIFQNTVKGEDYRSSAEYSYALIYKAFETKSHFFIYISNMQTHVIPKKDIITGTEQQLAQILSDRLGKKFKVLKIK